MIYYYFYLFQSTSDAEPPLEAQEEQFRQELHYYKIFVPALVLSTVLPLARTEFCFVLKIWMFSVVQVVGFS